MSLPPCAGRLDGWAGWAAFATGTLRPEPDAPQRVAADPSPVDTESDAPYSDDVEHATIVTGLREGHKSCSTSPTPLAESDRQAAFRLASAPNLVADRGIVYDSHVYWREIERLRFLRRVQHVDPRERRG